MADMKQHNFHVPLPEAIYQALRQESERSKQPATVLAREAIEYWLEQREKELRQEAIRNYALEVGGSRDDFDSELEATSLEVWKNV